MDHWKSSFYSSQNSFRGSNPIRGYRGDDHENRIQEFHLEHNLSLYAIVKFHIEIIYIQHIQSAIIR